MRFEKFKIKNFKGIKEIEINFNNKPDANIYTFVGLNESGKTTILEALNLFSPKDQDINALGLPGSIIKDLNCLIPISKRDNFNEKVSIEVEIIVENNDYNLIEEFARKNTNYHKIEKSNKITYYRNYIFENSNYKDFESRWSGFKGIKKSESKHSKISGADNKKLANFSRKLIPSILYFPNFLFDFPSKIYINHININDGKHTFYYELIQDILNSLNNNTNIEDHIFKRFISKERNDSRNLDSLLITMGRKVTEIIFTAWNEIFKRNVKDTSVIIKCNSDEEGVYLEFEIKGNDGIYLINERSLGFRWFFTFLLFTQFRPFRNDSPENIIFLFDEPASNLHSSAQKQLLKSFENLKNSKVIYTTHSHHMINPNWLESTYVVKNEGLNLDKPEEYNMVETEISITPYRNFAAHHPHNTAYFQPILDVLDYTPSNLENIPNCTFVEGKNDFYTLSYFNEVIFKNKYDLNLAPSTGSGNLDTLISLYLGWGKSFLILLDSDREGIFQKERYINDYGIVLENYTFTLNDINEKWINYDLENLIATSELLEFQKTKFPESKTYNKKQFNRAIQENLMTNKSYSFSSETIFNFAKLLDFLSLKQKELNKLKLK